jgi:hypothetical protein
VRAEKLPHHAGIFARPDLDVFGIDREIAVIVDVSLEVGMAPVVEGVGE